MSKKKYIILASDDNDIVNEAMASTQDQRSYWYNSVLQKVDNTASSQLALKNSLISPEDIVFTAHGNSDEVGNKNPGTTYDFNVKQFSTMLLNVMPEGYSGNIFVSTCDESIANFVTKVCTSLSSTKLSGTFIYGTNRPLTCGTIEGPKSVTWQPCKVDELEVKDNLLVEEMPMTNKKYIILASSDADIVKEARDSSADQTNYWYNSVLKQVDNTHPSQLALKNALVSPENIVFTAHGNSDEVGNKNPGTTHDFNVIQFSNMLLNVIPAGYDGEIFVSTCDESIANFVTKVCLSLSSSRLSGTFIYGTNKALNCGRIEGPNSVTWQSCKVTELEVKDDLLKLSGELTNTIASTNYIATDKSSCDPINKFISNHSSYMPLILNMFDVKSALLQTFSEKNLVINCVLLNKDASSIISNDNDFRAKACENQNKIFIKDNDYETTLLSLFALQGKEVSMSHGQTIGEYLRGEVESYCAGEQLECAN